MLYTNANINTLDFNAYENVYAVGCSFAKWSGASWADLIAAEVQGNYINLGKAGAGNLYMQTIISQLINTNKLSTSKDLLLVMWSTFYREDRYLKNKWHTPGNIFTASHEFEPNYIMKYADQRGMTMRDLAIIATTQRMLEHQSFDSVCMLGVGFNAQDYYAGLEYSEESQDLYEIYNNIKVLQPDLLTFNGGEWPTHYHYVSDHTGHVTGDYHPSSMVYFDFLKEVGLPMTARSKSLAKYSHEKMLEVNSEKQFRSNSWPWPEEYIGLGI